MPTIASSRAFYFIIRYWTGDWVCRMIILYSKTQRSTRLLRVSTVQRGWPGIWDSTLSISNIAMATSATNFSALIHEKGVTEAALRTEPDSCGKLYREYVPSLRD